MPKTRYFLEKSCKICGSASPR